METERRWWNLQPYFKKTFPFILAYAMTAHRCQGATFASHVIVHVRDAFCPGLLYVMLSRVTNRRFLSIVTPLTPADFTPAAVPTALPAVVRPCA